MEIKRMRLFSLGLLICFGAAINVLAQPAVTNSIVRFTEDQTIICNKTNATKSITAIILNSVTSPNAKLCQQANPQVCGNTLNTNINTLPALAMNTNSFGPTPYYIKEKGKHLQFLVKASEINPSNGPYYSIIKSISFYVSSMNLITISTIPSFTIKMKCTSLQQLTGNFEPPTGLITVFSGSVALPAVSTTGAWVKHNFTLANGFGWDGQSNVLIDVCFSGLPNTSGLNPIITGRTNMSYNSCVYSKNNLASTTPVCTTDSIQGDGTINYLPDMRFEICQPAQIASNYNITWSIIQEPTPGAGTLTGVTMTRTLIASTNGVYKVRVFIEKKTDPSDTSSAIYTLDVRTPIKPVIGLSDSIYCSNSAAIAIDDSTQPAGGNFSIVFGAGLLTTFNPKRVKFDPKITSTYMPLFNRIKYTYTDNPCVYTTEKRIGVIVYRDAELFNPPTKPICLNDQNVFIQPKFFFPYPNGKFIGYNVDSITGEFKHKLAGIGVHTVGYTTINNIDRCGGTDSIKVRVAPQPQFLIAPNELDGCNPFTIKFNTTGSSVLTSYNWLTERDSIVIKMDTIVDTIISKKVFPVPVSLGGATPTYTFIREGQTKIALVAKDTNGCADTTERYVNVFPSPNAKFLMSTRNTTNIFGDVIFTNKSTEAERYQWQIEDFANKFGDNQSKDFKYDFGRKAGTFEVKLIAYNIENCTDTARDTIVVKTDHKFFVPTAFNLNDKSVNGTFVYYLSDIFGEEGFKFTVFDKWGGKLFESAKIGDYWNGRKNNAGEKCQPGVYLWQMTFKDVSKKIQNKSGSILLIE
jgi:hypothetical protein